MAGGGEPAPKTAVGGGPREWWAPTAFGSGGWWRPSGVVGGAGPWVWTTWRRPEEALAALGSAG
jgi:hypothetical protein